ncbi:MULTISPECIES: DUF1826 domain-containing protein [Halomonadaceae]|uniref:DUF1826 domain-containing protein n=1 Tax=Halomonas johnsoniae TaxID=502832 RepID=A0ABQ2WCM0_9GAMM|nr:MULTISPECIES: DUF1826 domain-containing protein [Halomonas]MDM7483333.1 DUF1826 domain-containing protein [Halomonas sp.]GGW49965.1 hypothetical protein GCM10007158_08960 [Halomonas johnsoniae]
MTPLLSTPTQPLPSHAAQGHDISVLPQIFEAPINIAIFQRKLPAELAVSANAQSQTTRDWHYAWLGAPEEAFMADLKRKLPSPEAGDALVEDVATIAQAIAYLFDTDSVGIRLRLLTAAMCPRFHCDNLGVRLVCTYSGPGSEWLPNDAVNRQGLGAPHPDRPEIVLDENAIQRLEPGDIALIKGSAWEGSEQHGLVHRSPALQEGQKRLLLTIDPA